MAALWITTHDRFISASHYQHEWCVALDYTTPTNEQYDAITLADENMFRKAIKHVALVLMPLSVNALHFV